MFSNSGFYSSYEKGEKCAEIIWVKKEISVYIVNVYIII